ncbi:MAG: hypothetical protein ABIT71_27055 [Vicinamibacteraceae bacterium]
MSHLSRDERLLALDGGLDTARQAHLGNCTACRADVEALSGVLARVRAVDVPEPSPLFWDYLAARVEAAISREPAPTAARGWWSPRLAWAAIAVVVTAAGAGVLSRSIRQPVAPIVAHVASVTGGEPSVSAGGAAGDVDGPIEGDATSGDDGWALLAAVAEEAGPDDAFAPAAGQAELAISSLTAEERTALAGELAAALAPMRTREG